MKRLLLLVWLLADALWARGQGITVQFQMEDGLQQTPAGDLVDPGE